MFKVLKYCLFNFYKFLKAIINPDNIPALPGENHYFPAEVYLNLPKTLRYLSLIFLILIVLGIMLVNRPKNNTDNLFVEAV